LACISELNVAY